MLHPAFLVGSRYGDPAVALRAVYDSAGMTK